MAQKIDVSIIVPAFNEAAIIDDTLTKLARFVHTHKQELGSCEIVVVAAGSDETANIAQKHAEKFDAFTLVTPPRAAGKGQDVREGFLHAKGDVQLFMDADLSVPLLHVTTMVDMLRSGESDGVIGRRNLSKIHSGAVRSLVSVATNLLTRATILPRIHDTQCGFKGFTKQAAKRIFARQRINGWGFDVELLVHARETGVRVAELAIPDWREARTNELAGSSVGAAALTTLAELARICGGAYWRWCVRRAAFAPLLAAIGTLLLAYWVGPFQSIWFDEAYSAMLINQPLDKLLHFTGVDVHPPLYYLVLKAWAAIFGHSEIALRSLSMISGALAAAVGVYLVRYMFGARAALLALPFVTFAPLLIRYDIEMRMYAPASLICILATYVLVRAFTATKWRKIALWCLYAVLVAAGMYTLYYTALIWIVHFVWCVYMMRAKPQQTIFKQPWLWAYFGAVALFLPWMGWFLWQAANVQGGFWIGPVTIREVLNVVTMALTFHPQWQLDPWASLVTMIGIVISTWFIGAAFRHTSGVQRRYFVLMLLYAFLPIVFLFLASLPPFKPVFLERYFSHTIIGAYLLLGVAIAYYRPLNLKAKLAAGALLLVLVTGVISLHAQTNYNFNTLKQPSAREAIAYIQGQNTPDATIIADHWALYFEVVYYKSGPNVRFYDKSGNVSANGGSAMLHDSSQVISDASQLTAKTVYYIYYEQEPLMPFPPDYKRTNVHQINDYKIATYKRQ